MEESKAWWKSKTVWASAVTLITGALVAFGLISEDAQSAIVAQVPEYIIGLVTIGSGALALIGRVTAKTKLKASDQA